MDKGDDEMEPGPQGGLVFAESLQRVLVTLAYDNDGCSDNCDSESGDYYRPNQYRIHKKTSAMAND
jgi:hypothetical protein